MWGSFNCICCICIFVAVFLFVAVLSGVIFELWVWMYHWYLSSFFSSDDYFEFIGINHQNLNYSVKWLQQYTLYLICPHVVVKIIKFYGTVKQVRVLACYKTRFLQQIRECLEYVIDSFDVFELLILPFD